MSWCFQVKGKSYHWIKDLYDRLKLPVIPAIVEALQAQVMKRMKEVEKGRTDKKKRNRIQMKVARAEDQLERKKWAKRQALQHTYGNDAEDDDDDDDEVDDEVDASLIRAAKEAVGGVKENNDGTITMISGRTCRCGSKEHKRTSHSACPLNSKNKSKQ